MDGSHLYFLKSDVDELRRIDTLDDALKAGDVVPGFEIYNRYYQRSSSSSMPSIG